MPKKWLGGWVILLAVSASSGCCWWCDHFCPHAATTYAPMQAPICCPQPVCCPPGYAPAQTYGAAPAGYQNWSNPQRVYSSQSGCCE